MKSMLCCASQNEGQGETEHVGDSGSNSDVDCASGVDVDVESG